MCTSNPPQRCAAHTRPEAVATRAAYERKFPDGPAICPLEQAKALAADAQDQIRIAQSRARSDMLVQQLIAADRARTEAKEAKRLAPKPAPSPTPVTYKKIPMEHDYVDARFELNISGKKVGEVTRDRSSGVVRVPGQMIGMTRTATTWEVEAPGFRSRVYEARSRVDAVMDYLTSPTSRGGAGMNQEDARSACGKTGMY
jgi:hypothetical protein